MNQKITIVLSKSDPLLQNANMSKAEITNRILETFAKKINHNLEFIVINETLSDVFDTGKSYEQFTRFYLVFGKP